jgi:DNA-damage-inducible protein D
MQLQERGPEQTSLFSRIRRETEEGFEYWSARDLAKALGYEDYRNFLKVVEKARTACENSGQAVDDHYMRLIVLS